MLFIFKVMRLINKINLDWGMKMKVAIAGGSGFIGRKLAECLIDEGYEVVILTRKRKISSNAITYAEWLKAGAKPEKELENVDIVINLAGVSINNGRWNAKHQKEIYNSRMIATEEVLRIIAKLHNKPSVLINASAVGIYPASLNETYTEESPEIAKDFLGSTVKDWEKRAKKAEEWGVRVVFMRFGVVLGNEGALPLMTLPYKLFVGGSIGSGEQWVSWIHITDVVRSIAFVIENQHLRGPVNITSPNPLKMKDFGKTVGSVLKRPHWIPTPSFLMRLVLGQKSKLVLEGQHVLPKVLVEAGFEFQFPTLRLALGNLLKR